MVPSRQDGAEAPRPTGGSPWPSIVHASGSAATREPRRYARRRGSWPPRGLPARPIRAPGRTTGATRGAVRGSPWPGRPARPGRPRAGRGGCASRTGRRATWPASARRRASARVRPCADTACRGTGARRPAGPRGAGAGTSGTGRAPSDWAMLGCGDCLAALSAAESAEVACDGPGAKAEGVARASDPGPPVDTPVRARGRVPPRSHALGGARAPRAGGWAASRGTAARSCAGCPSRVPGSSRGTTRRAARRAERRCPSRSQGTRGPAREGSSDVAGSWSPEARYPARPTPPRPPRWRC